MTDCLLLGAIVTLYAAHRALASAAQAWCRYVRAVEVVLGGGA